MDLNGEKLSVLPYEAKFIVSMFLPLSFSRIKSKIGLCMADSVSKDEIKRHLKDIVDQGDPIFILEFYKNEKTSCILPFKASLILKSIDKGDSCLYMGPVPDLQPRNKTFKLMRWWFYPITFMLMCWIMALRPDILTQYWI